MGTLKEFFKTDSCFYGMKDDNLYLMCLVKSIRNNGSKIVISKYYIKTDDFRRFKKSVVDGTPFEELNVPRIGYRISTLNPLHFRIIFGFDINPFRDGEKDFNLNEINFKLTSMVFVYENGKHKRIENFKDAKAFNAKFNEAFASAKQIDTNIMIDFREKPSFFRIYNVGQANCSALFADNYMAVFDLGNKNKQNAEPITMLKKQVPSKRISMFVISHYHEDHVNLANHLPLNKLKSSFFVVPFTSQPNNICIKARFLILAVLANNIPLFVMTNSSAYPFFLRSISLFKGNGSGVVNLNERMNADGIVSYISLNDKRILIPGDSLYEYWPASFNPTHILVPHHACEYGQKPPNIALQSVAKAFVLSKCNRKYHHPNITHTNYYHDVEMFAYKTKDGKNRVFNKKRLVPAKQKTNITFIKGKKHIDW